VLCGGGRIWKRLSPHPRVAAFLPVRTGLGEDRFCIGSSVLASLAKRRGSALLSPGIPASCYPPPTARCCVGSALEPSGADWFQVPLSARRHCSTLAAALITTVRPPTRQSAKVLLTIPFSRALRLSRGLTLVQVHSPVPGNTQPRKTVRTGRFPLPARALALVWACAVVGIHGGFYQQPDTQRHLNPAPGALLQAQAHLSVSVGLDGGYAAVGAGL
jgi:hypothetical protein